MDDEYPDWDPDEESESCWDGDPECPRCGHAQDCLYEVVDDSSSETETECGNCGLKLTVTSEYSVEYMLSYRPPTDDEIEAEFTLMLARVRRYLQWKQGEPKHRAESEARQARRDATAKTWDEYVWPDWITKELRAQIMNFWGPSMGRGPFERLEDWRPDSLPLGTHVTLAPGTCHEVEGRYVHCWNNVGRVVDARGGLHYCSEGRNGLSHFRVKGRSCPEVAIDRPSLTSRFEYPRS